MPHNQLGAVELIGRILPKNAALHLVVPPPPASGDLFSFQAHASPGRGSSAAAWRGREADMPETSALGINCASTFIKLMQDIQNQLRVSCQFWVGLKFR